MNSINIFCGVFFVCLFATISSHAGSIAESLTDYEYYISINKVKDIPDSNISGAALTPDSKGVFIVDDKSCTIYQLDAGGNLIRTITTTGFSNFEGITRYNGNSYFVIEEDPNHSDIVRIEIPATGDGPVSRNKNMVLTLAQDWGNEGLEGISYRASDGKLFAAKQKNPSRLFRIGLTSSGKPDSVFNDVPWAIGDISSDISDMVALSDGKFLLINGLELKLTGYTPDGKPLSTLDLSGMKKPEGLAVDETDGTIYVTGEQRQFYVYKKKTPVFPSQKRNAAIPEFICNRIGPTTLLLRYVVPNRMRVSLELFSVDGKKIARFNFTVNPDMHPTIINAPFLGAGLFFSRFIADSYQTTTKICSIQRPLDW
jgi:uncharacterized protein YjiK